MGMKYINKLTDDELRKIYELFVGGDEIVSLNITREENDVRLKGIIRIADPDDATKTLEDEDMYLVYDYKMAPYHWSNDDEIARLTKEMRKILYTKFGEEYAKNYLLGEE